MIHSEFHTSHHGILGMLGGDRGDEGKHGSSLEGKAVSNAIKLR